MNKSEEGYWGNRTSTIDWCEENYQVTSYIAEFWNTISNLVIILLPLYGIYWSLKLRSKYRSLKKQQKNLSLNPIGSFKVPTTIIFCHIGLLLVGLGSWLFHMTLLYPMQLLDEIPMLWGMSFFIYANYDMICSIDEKSKMQKIYKFIVLFLDFGFVSIATFIYIYYFQNPVFHEVCFTFQVLIILIENYIIIKKLKLSPRLHILSFAYYFFAFVLWNIDNQMCDHLKFIRHKIDGFIQNFDDKSTYVKFFGSMVINSILIFFKSFTELHAFWHVFSGYGAYLTTLSLLDSYYENLLIKRFKNSSSTDSIRPFDEGLKLKNMKTRPVITKMFSIIYGLNTGYFRSKLKRY